MNTFFNVEWQFPKLEHFLTVKFSLILFYILSVVSVCGELRQLPRSRIFQTKIFQNKNTFFWILSFHITLQLLTEVSPLLDCLYISRACFNLFFSKWISLTHHVLALAPYAILYAEQPVHFQLIGEWRYAWRTERWTFISIPYPCGLGGLSVVRIAENGSEGPRLSGSRQGRYPADFRITLKRISVTLVGFYQAWYADHLHPSHKNNFQIYRMVNLPTTDDLQRAIKNLLWYILLPRSFFLLQFHK